MSKHARRRRYRQRRARSRLATRLAPLMRWLDDRLTHLESPPKQTDAELAVDIRHQLESHGGQVQDVQRAGPDAFAAVLAPRLIRRLAAGIRWAEP
jgi:hypothetical protein